MGPNDPFGGRAPADTPPSPLVRPATAGPHATSAGRFIAWGALLGATLGAVGLLAGARAAVILALCAAVGALFGQLVAVLSRFTPRLGRVLRAVAGALGEERSEGSRG